MQKLPIGIQDFRKIREDGYLYIDKTSYVYELATQSGYYFLSRPRRFGKSLLVSTFKELFEGSKELFEGLWIEDHWDWEKRNPVIYIPFAGLDYKMKGLYGELQKHIQESAEMHGISLQDDSLKNQFEELLRKLAESKGRVVLLIDEYDKPIIDYLGKEIEQARENQQVLKNFYSVIKDSDPYIRMVFITGVSKFSRVSIFSDLNNLDDLSLQDHRSNTLLGYTQEELEHFFSKHIASTAPKLGISEQELTGEIRRWYNGYSWNGLDFVYNPFSVLSFFQKAVFRNYWFATATPTFLINLIKEKQYYNFDNVKVGDAFFEAFQINNDISVGTLLFQTGYLTIKEYDPETELYTLAFPNREVKKSMLEHLLGAFAKLEPGFGSKPVQNARRALQTEDFELLKNTLNEILYNIPYQLYKNKERVYHLLIHIFFDYIGLDIHSEVNTARGRADVLVELEDKIYAIEFKIDQSAEEALNQIKERGYLDKYRSSGKKLIAIGVNFSTEKREVDEFAVEVL